MTTQTAANVAAANKRIVKRLVVVACAMFGFGFLLVPFYEQICEIAGIRSVIRPVGAPVNTQVDYTRSVTIELDSNTRDLPWIFKPKQRSVAVHPGELTTVVYEVRNTQNRSVTGQAIPSFGPQVAGLHFQKLECFCFQQQTLAAGEVRDMPVVFLVDTELPADINTITLSYTFFEVPGTDGKPG